eukprot:365492-Chlamydomonas_euryale.AAC.9
MAFASKQDSLLPARALWAVAGGSGGRRPDRRGQHQPIILPRAMRAALPRPISAAPWHARSGLAGGWSAPHASATQPHCIAQGGDSAHICARCCACCGLRGPRYVPRPAELMKGSTVRVVGVIEGDMPQVAKHRASALRRPRSRGRGGGGGGGGNALRGASSRTRRQTVRVVRARRALIGDASGLVGQGGTAHEPLNLSVPCHVVFCPNVGSQDTAARAARRRQRRAESTVTAR